MSSLWKLSRRNVLWQTETPRNQPNNSLPQVAGDPQILEVELAKLKVLVNDIAAHQASVDTLNDAGAQIVQQGTGMWPRLCFCTLLVRSFS